jgi:Protein of unknown function (DUF2924)
MRLQSGTVYRLSGRGAVDEVRKAVAELPKLDRRKLLELWRTNFGAPVPTGIRRELMVPMLAYRIQENAYGGLKEETVLKLRRLAQRVDGKPSRVILANQLKTGTRIIRRWRGQTYEVEVVDGGFLCQGSVHRSLFEIARKITGKQWSGPRFFGLKQKVRKGETA